MKVLAAVVLAPHWEVAGGANAALRLSTALADICDIDLARMAASDTVERQGGLTVYERRCTNPLSAVQGALPQSLFTLFYRADIPELIQTKTYDLVHIHNPMPALEMRRIARACLQAGIPYVVSTHGLVEFSSRGRAWDLGRLQRIAWAVLVDRPFREVMRHASRVLALTPADLPILSALGCRADRIVIVPNGVQLPAARSDPAAIERLCAKLGLPFPNRTTCPCACFWRTTRRTRASACCWTRSARTTVRSG
jgi:glycosyltransferase involved in cell wall biosynthesis